MLFYLINTVQRMRVTEWGLGSKLHYSSVISFTPKKYLLQNNSLNDGINVALHNGYRHSLFT